MTWGMVGGAAVSVIGGSLLGGSGSSQEQKQKQELDPRIQGLLYDNYTGGGLLGDVNNLSKQQLGQGGLNPMQSAGLEMQRQTLIDPRYSQGYEQMRSMGSGLMGAGVAGNPFTSGQGLYKNMGAPVTQPAYSQAQPYQQNQATLAASMPINSMPAAPAVAQAPVMDQSALQEFMRQWQAQQDAKNQQNTNDSGGSA